MFDLGAATPAATPAKRRADNQNRETAGARLGNGGHAGQAGGGRGGGERRALGLDVVVDDAVIPAVDHAVIIEVTVRVAIRAGDLGKVVDEAVIAAVDRAIEVGVTGVGVHRD